MIARTRRSLGEEVFFLTGLDEHGKKVKQAAEAEGLDAQTYCDRLAVVWRNVATRLQLSLTAFVRTSEPRHRQVVQALLTRLQAGGHFYRSEYRGFFSPRQETFLTEKDRRADGTFDPFYGDAVELVGENYYFRLREHQSWWIDHVENHPGFIEPDYRRNEVLGFLQTQTVTP